MSNQPIKLGDWKGLYAAKYGNQGNQPSPQSHVPVQQLSNPSPYRPYQPPVQPPIPSGARLSGITILYIISLLAFGYGIIGIFGGLPMAVPSCWAGVVGGFACGVAGHFSKK